MSDDIASSSSESAPGPAGLGAFAAFSAALADAVERLGPSTLAVPGRGRGALASAVVWRPGIVVTVAHVFRRAPATLELLGPHGRTLAASAVGLDPSTDLAVFRLADAAAAPAAPTTDGAQVRTGALALLVGRSARGEASASFGLVNQAGGEWRSWLGGRLDRLIRLDGGVHPGLSGGPVADAEGRVFGIASAALSRHYGIVVPGSTVDTVVDALLAGGRVARAFLGISAQPVDTGSAEAPSQGLLITGLVPGGPAAQAGLLVGDILLAADGQSVDSLHALRHALAGHVGQAVPVSVLRGGVPTTLSLTVGEWPQRTHRC
jgi:serine protease Do